MYSVQCTYCMQKQTVQYVDTKYDTGPVYNKILLCMDQNKILYYEDGKLGVYVH